jgi:hypothetical protein
MNVVIPPVVTASDYYANLIISAIPYFIRDY